MYISDLDGTLLLSDGTLSHQSIQRLNRMIERGLKFTIATARNYDSVYPILKGLNLQIPVVLFNGVYLTDFPTGRNVFLTDFIARDVVNKMMAMVGPLGLDPFIYTYEDQHRVYYRNAGNPGAQAYLASLEGDGRLRKVKQYEFSALEKISGFLLIDSRKILKPIYQELQKKYPEELNIYFAEDVSHKGYYWLQAFHQQANKGRMVRLLAQYLKKPLEEVVVFGDYLNDLEMFRIAGHSVAVANALPEVKALAHEVIGSNENGAVIDYLESVCFGN
ncbi:MAG: HAD family hydrolase [Nitrospinaceae bacterium]